MINVHKSTTLTPTIGKLNNRRLLRCTPIRECLQAECPAFEGCNYKKRGKCKVEMELIDPIFRMFLEVMDEFTDFQLLRVGIHILPLYQDLVRIGLEIYPIKKMTYLTDKGTKKVNPLFAEKRAIMKEISREMKDIEADKKWDKKFGVKTKTVSGREVEEALEHGEHGFAESLSKED